MAEQQTDSVAEKVNKGGGATEIVFAIVVCLIAMFLPVVVIEHGFEDYVAKHGIVREGAAGTTLALAVVVRTVLRNFIRTSTRAGLRMGMKSSMRQIIRVTTRNTFATILGIVANRRRQMHLQTAESQTPAPSLPVAPKPHSNLGSLVLGSILLYASWVIVIGFGQPFADLLTAEQAEAAEAQVNAELDEARSRSRHPGVVAYEMDVHRDTLREAVIAKRRELKATRSLEAQAPIIDKLSELNADLTIAQTDLSDALMRSGGRITHPDEIKENTERSEAGQLQRWLFTRSPYTGLVDWKSPVIWGVAALFVLPLWLIYITQAGLARRLSVPLRHETGFDGGLIQLYFAGAFSFMPLSSDVVIEGGTADRGRISLAGILAPTVVSIALWMGWKTTGETSYLMLFASDAFLVYPMVQCFPLDPLDGSRLLRWRRGLWLLVFLFVMATFVFMGSEGLKNVI